MMQAYTEEQRKALIVELETEKTVLEKWRDDWNARDRLNYRAICITLASLTAEPVAYIMGEETIDDFNRGYEFFAVRNAKDEPDMPSVPLYTAPPAPSLRLPGKVSCDGFNEKEPDEARNLGQCEGWNSCINEVKRLNATAPQPVPDGWKLVPVEPTRQMMSQGHFAMAGTDRGKFRRIYQAMVAAAPEVP